MDENSPLLSDSSKAAGKTVSQVISTILLVLLALCGVGHVGLSIFALIQDNLPSFLDDVSGLQNISVALLSCILFGCIVLIACIISILSSCDRLKMNMLSLPIMILASCLVLTGVPFDASFFLSCDQSPRSIESQSMWKAQRSLTAILSMTLRFICLFPLSFIWKTRLWMYTCVVFICNSIFLLRALGMLASLLSPQDSTSQQLDCYSATWQLFFLFTSSIGHIVLLFALLRHCSATKSSHRDRLSSSSYSEPQDALAIEQFHFRSQSQQRPAKKSSTSNQDMPSPSQTSGKPPSKSGMSTLQRILQGDDSDSDGDHAAFETRNPLETSFDHMNSDDNDDGDLEYSLPNQRDIFRSRPGSNIYQVPDAQQRQSRYQPIIFDSSSNGKPSTITRNFAENEEIESDDDDVEDEEMM